MHADSDPLSPTMSPAPASRFGKFIYRLRLFARQVRQALGSNGLAWIVTAAAVGLICGAASIIEIAISLRPSAALRSRDEALKMVALDSVLDDGYHALTQTILAVEVPSSTSIEGPNPLRSAWTKLIEAMTTSCAGTYGSPELTLQLAKLCASFPPLRDRFDTELLRLDPPARPLAPSIARELEAFGEAINETTDEVARLTTRVFEQTADRYRFAIAILAVSTTGFLATSFIFIFLVGRGSILHFEQWQNAVGAARQASEARDLLNETIEALPAGVVLYDAEERLLLFNSEAASTTPILREPGVIGMSHGALASASRVARQAAGLGPSHTWTAELIARFKSKGNRGLGHLPDGRWYEAYERLTPGGHTVGLRVDVTALKTRELELERAQAEYHALVDSLSDVVFAIDTRGVFTFVSAASADLLGKPPSEVIGTSFRDYVDPVDLNHVVAIAQALVRSPSTAVQHMQFRMKSTGGRSRHVEIRFRKTVAGNIQNAVISGVMRDVEERMQLAQRLARETARLRSIVESSGALILMIDRDLRVVMINSEFTQISGIRAIDAMGRPFKDVISCPIDPAVVARWLNSPPGKRHIEPQRFMNTLTDAAGVKRIINVTATPVTDDRGIVRNIVFLGVDDTARRETELQLFDAERMKGLGEIAATVAHELNQPLQVISFATEGMLEEIDEAADGNPATSGALSRQKLTRILEQVDRASRLINELRSHARSTSTEEPVAFTLEAAVRGAVNLTEHLVNRNGAKIAVAVPAGLPPVVGHLNRLEQVLINLLNNARDSLGELKPLDTNRLITVSAELVPGHAGDFLRLVVDDTGVGIAEHVLKRLFEPFLTTKPRGKGTGLGLSLSKRIVEEMGGTIKASNRPEGGARFEITLPAAVPEPRRILAPVVGG